MTISEWYLILALFAAVVVIAFVITLVRDRKRKLDHDPTVVNDDDIN